MQQISKAFSGVQALKNVDFTLCKGEVHALMGENGAGKSTLIKVLTGVYQKDSGQIYIKTIDKEVNTEFPQVYADGLEKSVNIKSPQEAQSLGISTVYQEITLCPNLTVAENMFIGRENNTDKGFKAFIKRFSFVRWGVIKRKTKNILENLEIPAKPTQQLANCSLAVQQMVAIARAVDMDCKVLILDEPTSSLDEKEVEKLFALMRELKSRGVGIIFVTHFLDQVYKISDRITVLRNGELVGTYEAKNLPRIELVKKMMGKELETIESIKKPKTLSDSKTFYEAKGLSSAAGVKPFDFKIKKGEVNGFAGLLGSGRSESVRAIFGADRVTGGSVCVDGKNVKIKKPMDAIKQGISYLPEDRKNDGIIADLSVRENIIMALQVTKGFFRPFSKKKANAFAEEYIKLLGIKTASADTPIKSLSGGNQQKAILARWLLTHPKYLILDEPTRGIDVGTKVEIQKLILKLASEGMAITFISSEIEEMLNVCSRLIVMRDRNILGELTGKDLTQDKIVKTIAGGAEHV